MVHPALLTLLLTQASDSTVIARVDSALAAEAHAGFSGVVLIARGERVLLEQAYGRAAVGSAGGMPAFWLASNSKQFTAAAILRLQDAGRLRVTDSIARFFRDVPRDKRAITIHQLLTHTSGLPTEYRADGERDRARAVAAILQLQLRSRPGARYSYSVDGYVLLAAIVDATSGVGYDAFISDSLFGRAGMTNSGVWGQERRGVPIASVADARRVRAMPATIYRNGQSVGNWGYRGTTGAYVTARDFHRWIQALRNGKILHDTSVRALLGRHVLVSERSGRQTFTGYGWGVTVEHGRDVSYGHNGDEDWLGHNSVIRFAPDGEIVAVLSNSGEAGGRRWSARVNHIIRHIMAPAREDRVSSKFWLAAASYLVLTFIIAAGWHLALFKHIYARLGAFTRARPIVSLGILSMVFQAVVVAYLYPVYYRGGAPLVEGATFGLLLGVFMGSNAVLAEAGKNQVGSIRTWIALEGVYYLVQFLVVGAVIGLVYGQLPGRAV